VTDNILLALQAVLVERKNAQADSSYVAKLYAAGDDKILKKLGEEAVECIIAAKGGQREEIIHETADLWFHVLVMLAHHNIRVEDITAELQRRFGRSGIEEKAARKP